MRLLLCLISVLLWVAVYGVSDREAYTNYLMTANIDDIVMANRRTRTRRPPAIEKYCKIHIEGPSIGALDEDSPVTTLVICSEKVLHNDTTAASALKPVSLENGIRLFAQTPYGGDAYLYLESPPTVDFKNSTFLRLPPLRGKNVTAPVVVKDGLTNFEDTVIANNIYTVESGGIYVAGTASLDYKKSVISHGVGKVGALVASGASVVRTDYVDFIANEGEIVGGIYVTDKSTFIGFDLYLEQQSSNGQATCLFVSGHSSATIVKSHFYGAETLDHDYASCLLDPAHNDTTAEVECNGRHNVGAITLDDKALIVVVNATFKGHSSKRGTILASGTTQTNIRQSVFEENVAHVGAGMFIQGEHGSSATALDCTFRSNVARYGGGMVAFGNGSFTFATCHFDSNRALSGGGIWGDYTNTKALVNGTCERSSAGSRVTVLDCKFTNNTAISNGGAFFVKCTNIFTNITKFHRNSAGGNGGALYVADTYDLDFIDCDFDSNTANSNGGAVFASNSHTIYSKSTNFTNSVAQGNGGAIASFNGFGINLRDSKIVKNKAINGNGGAIFAEVVDEIDAMNTDLTFNSASQSGGALALLNSTLLQLKNIDVSSSSANANGGAIRAHGGIKTYITEIKIDNTQASSSALSLQDMGEIYISNFDFVENVNITECGGLEINGATSVSLSSMNFKNNEVKGHGGALCVSRADSADLANLVFSNNKAKFAGGAVDLKDSTNITFKDTLFQENSAVVEGGAIKGHNIEQLKLERVHFTLNDAQWKGGAVFTAGSSVFIRNTTFHKNYVGTQLQQFLNKTSTIDKEQNQTNQFSMSQPSGVVCITRGKNFSSQNSVYEFNEAEALGGSLMIDAMESALIQYDTYQNSSASTSGGCILVTSVFNLSLWDSTLQYCSAGTGGALSIEGNSHLEGGYLKVSENVATESGGALLCRGNSKIQIEATNFSYNSAEEGSSVSVDCRCDIDFSVSAFYRDKHVPHNGRILHTQKGCGKINTNGCRFYGDAKKKHSFNWIWVIIGGVALVAIFAIVFVVYRRHSKRRQEDYDVESGAIGAPLMEPGPSKGHYQTATLKKIESEEYSSYTGSSGSGSSYTESTNSEGVSGSEEGSEDFSTKKRTSKPRGTYVQYQEITPMNEPKPIGKRSHEAQKQAVQRRIAQIDKVNDGAGPSGSGDNAVMPPDLGPVVDENVDDAMTVHTAATSAYNPPPSNSFLKE